MKIQNYFDTQREALDAAYCRAVHAGAEFDLAEWQKFCDDFGPVSYGQTVRSSVLLFKWNGKLNYRRALTVVLYRMESGKYELVSYLT